MADLTPFAPVISQYMQQMTAGYTTQGDPRTAFAEELAAAGFKLKAQVVVDKLTRVDDPQDKKGQGTGWYIYHELPDARDSARTIGIGVYGSWRGNPERVVWTSKTALAMSDEERAAYNLHLEAARIAREQEQRQIHAEAATRAAEIYNSAQPVSKGNAYLARKMVTALGPCRESRGDLVLPVMTPEGTIASLQFIKPDGEKRFLTGGRKKGCFYTIPGSDTLVYIAEGYATAASVHMATGGTCYVAFDAGNLYEVAVAVKAKHPTARLVLAGDDDAFSGGNAGRTKATQAAQALGIECVFPTFSSQEGKPTDWNDLYVREGMDAVKRQLVGEAMRVYEAPATAPAARDGLEPNGILADLMHYYNATSGNDQPMFAIQTAVGIVSVLAARNFTTNFSNRSSLYLMNLAKSGTGKEHAKRVIERVLDAVGHGRLVGLDGYTAGGSVFSALMERPRHIAVIDEFSKYLQAAQNKFSGSHMMEANSQLMQAFGRLDGVMRPKSYSAIGLTKEKRKELAEMQVVNPAITLLAMSTPEDLFEKLDVTSIKDGFLNRFLVCTSEAPRAVREHREGLDIPQSIKDWAAKLDNRRGAQPELSSDTPSVHTLTFTTEAIEMQRGYQQECIDLANSLEKFGLAEMPMRSNEIAMRLALIHALSRDPWADLILPQDMGWGMAWSRHNRDDLIRRLKMCVSGSDFEAMKKAVLAGIRAAGQKGVTLARMQVEKPYSTFRKRDLAEALEALEQADLVFKEGINSGKRGRPTLVYYAHAD